MYYNYDKWNIIVNIYLVNMYMYLNMYVFLFIYSIISSKILNMQHLFLIVIYNENIMNMKNENIMQEKNVYESYLVFFICKFKT